MSSVPLAGVIGTPIDHSKSPKLHQYWLKKHDIKGYYVPLDVAPGDLASVIRMMPRMGFVGANVTIPHKEAALSLADLVTDRASLIGAANTLIFREDGKIHADNTDGYGFVANLRQHAPDWVPDAGPVTVLGAGGACRAVIASLLDIGATKIYLSNRTRDRAEDLRRDFGTKIEVIDWHHAGNVLEDSMTVVNTTSLGMSGKPELRVPLDGLRKGALVTDLVYTPLETRLLREARAAGCVVVDGLGMLLHQAVPGFERWFGTRPTVDDDIRRMVLG
jgi:shikimate dehydrogenase